MLSGVEAERIGKGDSKYRPTYFQGVYLEFDVLINFKIVSKDFQQAYSDFCIKFGSRRQSVQRGPNNRIRTTKAEIDAMDDLIKLALKELEEKGY